MRYDPRHDDAGDEPQPRGIVMHFWREMGCTSYRVAERHLAITRKGINRLPHVCRLAGNPDYLTEAHLHSDAVRRVAAAPLPFTPELVVAVAKADSAEDQARCEYLANPSDVTRAAFARALRREIMEKQEELLSLESK